MDKNTHAPRSGRRQALLTFALAAVLAAAAPLASAADPIVIGQVAPFSGAQAVSGKAIHAGAKLYFDAVNARGGVRGRPIKFVTRDDGQKPEETVRLTKELIASEAPVAMLGSIGTANLEALAKDGVLVQQRVAMIGASSGAASVVQAAGIHVIKASYHDEVARLFQQLANLGVTRVGMLYQDDAFGRDVLAGAEAAAKKYGMELAVRGGYPRNTTEVDKAVAAIGAAKVQVVFLGATTAAAVEFVKQYTAAGHNATIYGLSVIDTDAVLKALGNERARGYAFSVVVPLQQQTNLAVVREYLQLKQASPDANLSARSLEGFIAAKALVRIMESSATVTPPAVFSAFTAAKGIDVGGYVLDFSDDRRAASRYVDFAMFGASGRIVQ